MYEQEESHFYYVSLHNLVCDLISRYSNNKFPIKILDAGCGTGALVKKLERFGHVSGIDNNKTAVSLCKRRDLDVSLGSITNLRFKNNVFDIVTCMDVLVCKEVKTDIKALNEIFRVLKPGGLIIIRVSANKWLKLKHDKHVHSTRRYTVAELESKIQQSNFRIMKVSYINAVLLPVVVIKSLFEYFFPSKEIASNISKVNPIVNFIVKALLNLENKLSIYMRLPFGLGLIVVAQKPFYK